jgi:hypothetical protein
MNAGAHVVSITTGSPLPLPMSFFATMPPRPAAIRHLLFWLVLILLNVTAHAQGPSVTAVLSTSEANVGEFVTLEIRVTGASNPKAPAVAVEGLQIQPAGTSREFQMNGLSVRSSVTYTYRIFPENPGTYTIPPQSVDVGGQTLKTEQLTLNVSASSGGSAQRGRSRRGGGSNPPDEGVDPARVGFIEMLLPKSTAYVGEMIPVQVRLALNARTPIESLQAGVQLTGQGFTTQKLTEPRQTLETIDGRTYQVFIFKTAISPVRAGTLEIGPAEVNPIVRVPQRVEPRSLMPRALDDPFFQNFFDDPFFRPSIPREVKLKSNAATLEVKPLPPDAPPTFAGAVGNFSMQAEAKPKQVNVGDPVTITATINGRGSFDRIEAPALEQQSGWHLYPPSGTFTQDDDVGISGAKRFELVVSPTEQKRGVPPLVFSFFDPVKERYVTLRSPEIPLVVQGGAAPTATPAIAAAGTPPPAQAAPTPAQPAEQDILHQLPEMSGGRTNFTPLYEQPAFWAAQALPLLVLLGLVGWKVRETRLSDREAQRVARLQAEAAELQQRLRSNESDARQYFADASRAVQLKTALARKVEPQNVDAETAATTFRADEQLRSRLRELFAQNDELRYSGNGHRNITPEQRRDIAELVEALRV